MVMTVTGRWGSSRLAGLMVAALFAVVLGVPLVMSLQGGAEESATAGIDGPTLIVVTPNNEQIRFEFEAGFNRWREDRDLPPVRFDWRAWGGTGDLRRGIVAAYEAEGRAALAAGRPVGGVGYDLFFGGGDYEHGRLSRGLTIEHAGRMHAIAIAEAPQLPDGLLEQAFPQPAIGGNPLYHPQRLWIGTALSSFGIVYNRDVLGMLDLPEPTTWADLVDAERGRYRGWIALADPANSGSVAATFELIVRRLGWREGWAVLRRVSANTRVFASSASAVPVDVSMGEAAAGMCIDFYGRYQAGAVSRSDGAQRGRSDVGRMGYVDPPFMTAITADPIMLLHGAPHRELAEQFIAWVISMDGQRLWQRRAGVAGGPLRHELRRLPVRRDLYAIDEMAHWTDQVDPFVIARPMPAGSPSVFSLVAPLAHAIGIDVHRELRTAWNAIVECDDPAKRQAMEAVFDAMPDDLTVPWPGDEPGAVWEAAIMDERHPLHEQAATAMNRFVADLTGRWTADPRQRDLDRRRWAAFFRRQYDQVAAMR